MSLAVPLFVMLLKVKKSLPFKVGLLKKASSEATAYCEWVISHLMKPANEEAACRLESAIFDKNGHNWHFKINKGSPKKELTP
jgi:hypothetical protein